MGPRKVLVLGINGMLGSMVYSYLSKDSSLKTVGSLRRKKKNTLQFDANDFLNKNSNSDYLKEFDYIINCIGVIKPYIKDSGSKSVQNTILINSIFPHSLANFLRKTDVKIIQIATDCVFSGRKRNYKEDSPHDPLDVYGKTKSLGEVNLSNFLNIRCSIIGPGPKNKVSLMDWFLKQKKGSEVLGFKHHKWNGVTTLQFAQLCLAIIEKNKFKTLVSKNNVHHFVPNESLTKFELLEIMNDVFNKSFKIKPVSNIGPPIDRTLSSKYILLSQLFGKSNIKSAIKELKGFII